MVEALEAKRQLRLISDDAEDTARFMVRRTSGAWESRRLQLLDTIPGVVAYYSEATASLAVDSYMYERRHIDDGFAAAPVVLDRTVKIRRGVAWASLPLSLDDAEAAEARMSQLLRSEIARPYRDTTITNRRQDKKCVGWKRIASASSCGFCKALAARGAVFKEETAHFASHDDCTCTAAAVFRGGEIGPEADVMQYMASGRKRTAREKAMIRRWASQYEDD